MAVDAHTEVYTLSILLTAVAAIRNGGQSARLPLDNHPGKEGRYSPEIDDIDPNTLPAAEGFHSTSIIETNTPAQTHSPAQIYSSGTVFHALSSILVRNSEVIALAIINQKAPNIIAVGNPDYNDKYFKDNKKKKFLLVQPGKSHYPLDEWKNFISIP